MIVELLIGGTAIGTVVGPALGILLKSRRVKAEVEKQLEEAYLKGRKDILDEIEKIQEKDKTVDYRSAARIAAKQCAKCKRACPHCAREGKRQDYSELQSHLDRAKR